jgi:hypothetical protein
MLENKKLVIEPFCEVYDLLEDHADFVFNQLEKHKIINDAIYVVGKNQAFGPHSNKLLDAIENHNCTVVLSYPTEGSQTLKNQVERVGFDKLIKEGRMLLIGGGSMEDSFKYLLYDHFLPKIFDYRENIKSSERYPEYYAKLDKPYKFLFLNGRNRLNRKYLLKRFELSGLLDQSLWTNLDSWHGTVKEIHLFQNGHDYMQDPMPVKFLPEHYEVSRYRKNLNVQLETYVKFDLFDYNGNKEWGEIYLNPEPYIDTYFSLVTETVFTYPYSFRTEKIWKPIAMCHPWIAVANEGFYRDIKNLGFHTFSSIIDESFDQISDNQKRIEYIATVVEDLCSTKEKLQDFMTAARPICEHNQRHLWQMRHVVRRDFLGEFKSFLRLHNVI